MNATTTALDRPIVTTTKGRVRGSAEKGISRFLGVPYAAPPFGPHRFELPQPRAPWASELDASRFGPTPPQTPYKDGLTTLIRNVVIDGEDILNLNIWTPSRAPGSGLSLPVVFWIYGGALTRGCNAIPLYDGTTFARRDIVFVGVNYRVGVEGFAELDGAPNNRGLGDLVAALEWVHDEIAAFGGNPNDVTAVGQSAGGQLVSMLLACPPAEGLFHKAMIMSASVGPAAEPPRPGVAGRIAELLGIPATREAFAALSPRELAEAQTEVMGNAVSGGPYYHPVPGDDLLPEDVWQAHSSGMGASVPVLVGTTTDEHRFWYTGTGLEQLVTDPVIDDALTWLKISPETLDLYARNRPGQSRAMVFGALTLDLICRVTVNMFADLRLRLGGATWVYEFAWESPVLDMGAAHCVDLPFLFDRLDTEDAGWLVGGNAPQLLADEFHGALVRFVHQGDPGWDRWTGERPVMTFDSPSSGVVNAPREEERVALTPA